MGESLLYAYKKGGMIMVWTICLLGLLIGVFLFYASYRIDSGIYIKAYCRGKSREKRVSLTFDDGPDPHHTPEVLDVLKQYGVVATFFCIGQKVEEHADLVRQIRKEGHRLGNHSYGHSCWFPLYSAKRMEADLRKAEVSLHDATGESITLFRPPFGVTNPTIAKVVKRLGYMTVGWDIRSFDTRGETEDLVFDRIVRQLRPGSVLLLHDRMPGTARLLVRLLEYLRMNQYKVIPTDEMFDN